MEVQEKGHERDEKQKIANVLGRNRINGSLETLRYWGTK